MATPLWTDRIVAGAALGALWFAWKTLREIARTRKDQQMPVISFRFRDDIGSGIQGYSYRLVNVGGGPALITNFQILHSRLFSRTGDFTNHVDSILGPSSGDPMLEIAYASEAVPPGSIGTSIGPPELRDPKAHYIIEYEDVFGRKFSTEFKNCAHKFRGPISKAVIWERLESWVK
jgi:hypothetical protein